MEWILSIRTEWLTTLMKVLTFLGDEEFFLLFLPLAYWLWKKDAMGRVGVVLLFTFVLNAILKGIFQMPRPTEIEHLVHAEDWSFPSGHAQGAMVLWGWLAHELKDKRTYVAAAFLIFGNLDSTTVWLWGFTLEMPLFLLLIIMFVLGMVLGGVVRSAFRKLRGAEPRTK